MYLAWVPPSLKHPTLTNNKAPWNPSMPKHCTETKRNGHAQGRQKCAWRHSLLFINHENYSCCLTQV